LEIHEVADAELAATHDPISAEESKEILDVASIVFESIAHVIRDLKFLAPSLRKPFPQDLEEYASSVTNSVDGDIGPADRFYVDLARRLFPSASKTLQNRLGRANYMRSMSQKLTQQEIKQTRQVEGRRKSTKGSRRAARQEIAQDAFNFQQPTLTARAPPAPRAFLPLMSVPSSAGPESDSGSVGPSVFDQSIKGSRNPLLRAGSETTLGTLSSLGLPKWPNPAGPQKQVPGHVPSPQFPKMPLQLEDSVPGSRQRFTCNLCGYDLEASGTVKTQDEWQRHVLQDLEPYLCTFDECYSALTMYAVRDEWYKHELEAHRITKVWACPACSQEFTSKEAVLQHLPDCEDKDDPESLPILQSVLKLSYTNQPLHEQQCPLCHAKIAPAGIKAHIAEHMEMFSLFSIQPENSSSEDDSDEMYSQTNDDIMSEGGRKEAVLENFVKEQLKMNIERVKGPPDRDAEGGIAFLDDLSEHDGSAWDSASRFGGRNDDAKNDLMAKMLGDRDEGGVRHTGAKRTNHRPAYPPGAPSLSSSAETMPLLRVASFPRNEEFMGRENNLASLYKILSEPGKVCVVSGEGGMGKTALAVEFSYRYEQSYHYIFWIQAETPVGSCDTFCQIALQLGLAADGTDTDTLIRLGREYLEAVKDKRWLMVFDNVDKWDDIDMYTPSKTSATNGSILITTRHGSLTAPSRPTNYYRIALQELDVDSGRNLLIHGLPPDICPKEKSLRDPEWKIAGEIALLAGLPLLIVYISGYVKQSGCTLSEFWDYWDEWRPKARIAAGTAKPTEPTDRENVFHIALRDLGSDAKKLLEIMAFLDSDGIQKELLVKAEGQSKVAPQFLSARRCVPFLMHGLENTRANCPRFCRFRTIIPNLVNQRFVQETRRKQEEGEVYHIHRVLQARLLRDLKTRPHERDEAFKTAFNLVRYHLPRPSLDSPDQSKWSVVKEYLPHVLSLQRAYADPLAITTPTPFHDLAELFKDGGVVLWQRYIHNDALKLLNSAEKILDDLGSDDENLRAEINVTINLLLQYFGISRRQEAKDRVERILHYRQRLCERKAPDQVTREDKDKLNNAHADYANVLLQFNLYEKAEPIYEKCYTNCIATAENPTVDPVSGVPVFPSLAFALAKINHHLAHCKMYRRDWPEAIRLANLAVTMIERVNDRQLTMRYQFDLACILLQSGKMNEAWALQRDILQARIGLQGRASYFSLQSQYAYAVLCHYLGKLDEAEYASLRFFFPASVLLPDPPFPAIGQPDKPLTSATDTGCATPSSRPRSGAARTSGPRPPSRAPSTSSPRCCGTRTAARSRPRPRRSPPRPRTCSAACCRTTRSRLWACARRTRSRCLTTCSRVLGGDSRVWRF
jgi:tetratricopeptide (TPR) repeat protein